MAAFLDYHTEEPGDCPFDQHHSDKMKYGGIQQAMTSSPCQRASSPPLQKVDLLWRMRRWLEQCEGKIDDTEIEW